MREAQPLTFALFERSPFPVVSTGLLLLAFLLALLLIPELLSGRPFLIEQGVPGSELGCPFILGDYRLGIVNALLLAYVASARYVFSNHSTANGSRLVDGFIDMDRYASKRGWGFVPGFVGIAITLAIAFDISERRIEWTSAYWITPHLYNWLTSMPLGWVGGRFVFAIIGNGVIISRLVYQQPIETVFNLSAMDPAYRQSSIGALLLTVFLGGASVHFVDPGAGVGSVLLLVVVFGVGLTFANIPLIGAVRSTSRAKRRELEEIQQKIVEYQGRLLAGQSDDGAMEALLSLERRILNNMGAFAQTYNIARLVLYGTLGLLSWLGAAAVERILDALLG
ncbi:MAG: hypothetical protein PVH91_01210 [Pseudomonadales bacterium]|jgi:hypothetical protein